MVDFHSPGHKCSLHQSSWFYWPAENGSTFRCTVDYGINSQRVWQYAQSRHSLLLILCIYVQVYMSTWWKPKPFKDVLETSLQMLITWKHYTQLSVIFNAPPTTLWGNVGGDLHYAKFKCTTNLVCQSTNPNLLPTQKIEQKMGDLIVTCCSTCIWCAVKCLTYGASFSVSKQVKCAYITQEGGRGHNIDRCITSTI